ncbi:energy-coupling factor ABC transporter ATP-binding protein [Candidatus Phytoplasma sacchari]|nr:ATP-binding cassette domain-containing protein [Candidatus Phytoplasma sacchari]KAB8122839.1 ATP-binding cassette domain-containing protein [Candidatus Phytoplasma sacchari]
MIIVKDLNFSYNNINILKNLNFEIADNKWVSIMGHNGSGKSTLAQILIGLFQSYKGQIFINNIELNENTITKLRSFMGIIFQNPDYQFVGFDVKSDIAFGLENKGLPRHQIYKTVNKYASMLGIKDLLDKKPQQLSGGQKQKVAIASVLAMEPEIIIFDEPTSFLDPEGSDEINRIITEISKTKKNIITITHDFSLALKSDEIIVLNNGSLWKYDKSLNFLKDSFFLNKFFFNLPLSLKLYIEFCKKEYLEKIDSRFLNKIKDVLWEYILKT